MVLQRKEREKIAIEFIKDGADNKVIAKYTKLTETQIETIRFAVEELQDS
jgi:hypothetical protein